MVVSGAAGTTGVQIGHMGLGVRVWLWGACGGLGMMLALWLVMSSGS